MAFGGLEAYGHLNNLPPNSQADLHILAREIQVYDNV